LISFNLTSVIFSCLICCNTASPIQVLTAKFLSLGWDQFMYLSINTVAIRCLINLLISNWLDIEGN
jgi:hypothetical protein